MDARALTSVRGAILSSRLRRLRIKQNLSNLLIVSHRIGIPIRCLFKRTRVTFPRNKNIASISDTSYSLKGKCWIVRLWPIKREASIYSPAAAAPAVLIFGRLSPQDSCVIVIS